MQHRLARRIIPLLLGGSGFDHRALALVDAIQLADFSDILSATVEKAISAAASLVPDHAATPATALTYEHCPEQLAELAELLLPHIIQNPAHIGRSVTSFHALAQLWNHATPPEREQLMCQWHASLHQRHAHPRSFLTSDTLCRWQSQQATHSTDEQPRASIIQGMLEESDPQAANNILSQFLGITVDVPQLTRILGALSVHVLLNHFDDKAHVLSALSGITSLHHLCDYANPCHLVTLLSQLAHQLWWCRNDGHLNRLLVSSTSSMSLHQAVRTGDITAACRAARIEAVDSPSFWQMIDDLLRISIDDSSHAVWTRGLTAVRIFHQRTVNSIINPDDAAAIAATFAAIHHLKKNGTARFVKRNSDDRTDSDD